MVPAGTSEAWATLQSLNVDFSANLPSPSLHSLFSLNSGNLRIFMPRSTAAGLCSAPETPPFVLSSGQADQPW